MTALGKNWHPHHLVCGVCGTTLSEEAHAGPDGGGPGLALVDHHDDGVARVVGWRIGGEPRRRLLAELLARAGLRGHGDLVEREPDEVARTSAHSHHAFERTTRASSPGGTACCRS